MTSVSQLKNQTFGDRLDAADGRPSGFDYLRVILAVSVIFFHSFDLTAGYNVAYHSFHGIFRPFDVIILPMFFALSGFLVAGSLERSKTLISFLGLRVIRLVPALLVETMLSAIVIGLLFSTYSHSKYFSDPMFYEYFLNILGDIHYNLPGVFEINIYPKTVNGQLWTIPWELKCYATIAVLSLIWITRSKSLFIILPIILNCSFIIYHDFFSARHLDRSAGDGSIGGSVLIFSFLYGISLYFLRRKIIWSKRIFCITIPLLFFLLSLPIAFWGDASAPLPAAYMTIYLGLLEPQRLRIVSSGDYSYGIYLYGFPIQQSIVALLSDSGQSWYVNFGISLSIASIIAVGSWHLVEKRAAKFRPILFKFENFIVRIITLKLPKKAFTLSK